jgi:hypothetical protein
LNAGGDSFGSGCVTGVIHRHIPAVGRRQQSRGGTNTPACAGHNQNTFTHLIYSLTIFSKCRGQAYATQHHRRQQAGDLQVIAAPLPDTDRFGNRLSHGMFLA